MKHIKDSERFSIIQPDLNVCCKCGGTPAEKHEVFNGIGLRQKSKDWGMVVGLCPFHHRLIHRNAWARIELKRDGQHEFEKHYGHAKFMEVFHKNYLEEEEWTI